MTYPTIMPALTLDFQNSQQLDPRVKFSRSSGATYTNSACLVTSAADHEARFDHDPTTGECLGLLMEESRTNYAENSEDFSLWTEQNSTVLTAQGTAPNGTNTAFKIQENTSNVSQSISHSIREPTNSTWSGAATMSCYVKPAGRNFAYMGFTGVSQTSVTFDLVNKVSSYKGSNVTSASVEEAGNGWVRIIAVFSSSITSGRATVGPAESDSGGGLNYVGDGSSGILAWGAQLEQGSFPTSYIPTSGSTVTRSADIAQMTGTNVTDWYNDAEGTFFYDRTKQNTIQNQQEFWIYPGPSFSQSDKIAPTWKTTQDTQLAIKAGNVSGTPFSTVNNTADKVAFALKTNDTVLATGGVLGNVANNTTLPGPIDYINVRYGSWIKRISYYNERLTDAELQTLTS